MKKLIFLCAAAGFMLSAQAQNQPYQSNQPGNQPSQSQPGQHQQSQTNQPQDRSQGVIQDKDVPAGVMSAFNSAYPNTSGVKWKRDGSNYKAMYETAGMNNMIIYDASGNLVKTKSQIETSQLPSK